MDGVPPRSLGLAVSHTEAMPFNKLCEINRAFEESNLDICVDIIDWTQTSSEFQRSVEQSGRVRIQQAGASVSPLFGGGLKINISAIPADLRAVTHGSDIAAVRTFGTKIVDKKTSAKPMNLIMVRSVCIK